MGIQLENKTEIGVEVNLVKDDFLAVKETLSRIGIQSKTKMTLYQSCHILHKTVGGESKYFIIHFKEMFALDGRETTFNNIDRGIRNKIIDLLNQWGLIKVVDSNFDDYKKANMSMIKIVKYSEKSDWSFVEKYSIGKGNKYGK